MPVHAWAQLFPRRRKFVNGCLLKRIGKNESLIRKPSEGAGDTIHSGDEGIIKRYTVPDVLPDKRVENLWQRFCRPSGDPKDILVTDVARAAALVADDTDIASLENLASKFVVDAAPELSVIIKTPGGVVYCE